MVFIGFTRAAPAGPTTWPALIVVYRVEGKFHGLNAPTDTEVWKLSYQDARHWQKQLLSSTFEPQAVGTVMSFQDSTYSVYSAVTKNTSTQRLDAPVVPEPWLVPGRDQVLVHKGFTRLVGATTGQVSYIRTESVPCQPDPTRSLNGSRQPAGCASSPTYQSLETITYRTDLALPIEVVSQLGSDTVKHIVVTQVTTP